MPLFYIDEIEKVPCPECSGRMIVFYDKDVYTTHGCENCKTFHRLENIEDYKK